MPPAMVPSGSDGSGRRDVSVCGLRSRTTAGGSVGGFRVSRGGAIGRCGGRCSSLVRQIVSSAHTLRALRWPASLLGEKFEPSDEIESESVSIRVDEGLLFSRETRFFDRRSHSSFFWDRSAVAPFSRVERGERCAGVVVCKLSQLSIDNQITRLSVRGCGGKLLSRSRSRRRRW